MNALTTIPVFFATDDNYVPCLAVCLRSLIDNAHPILNYKIHILNEGLKDENIKALKALETDFLKIEFNNVSAKIKEIKGLLSENLRDYYSNAIYYRIFIPTMFPEYEKAIYLDCDMIVRGDISKLFFTEIGDNLVGAVPDEIIYGVPTFDDYGINAVGIEHKKYFNSGMLLMNLNLMREQHLDQKFITLLCTYNFGTICPDQDYLNVICKGKVKYLPQSWNKMSTKAKYSGKLDIIHYNMCRKPWFYEKVPYSKYFWEYAEKTSFYQKLVDMKENFSKEQRARNVRDTKKLHRTAREIVKDPYNFKQTFGNKTVDELLETTPVIVKDLSPEQRMELYEKLGGDYFNTHVKDDPIPTPLKNVDFLKKKLRNKIKAYFANLVAHFYRKKVKKFVNLKIEGEENLKALDKKSGAIVTSNHFSEMDNVGVFYGMKKLKPRRNMFYVVREGNWHMPGALGMLLKHCNTLPLAQSYREMTKLEGAISFLLKHRSLILVYPEQSLWPNYKKPRPQKLGAFKFAAKNKVPVIPCFTTIAEDGSYTLHIMPLIYPDTSYSTKEAAIKMRNENYNLCVAKYEEVYGEKLKYACDEEK